MIGITRYEKISLSPDIIKLTLYVSRYKRFILSYWCHVFVNNRLVICCCRISLQNNGYLLIGFSKLSIALEFFCLSLIKYIYDLFVVLNFFNFFIPVFNFWVFIFHISFSLIFISYVQEIHSSSSMSVILRFRSGAPVIFVLPSLIDDPEF